MPTLILRFPGGRYHATPQGHHVNEGLLEWPPSPWRLVRALIAVGYTTQLWSEVPPPARRLFTALTTTLPRYRLPAASLAHTRHFMPMGVLDKGREKTTLVFDSFADVGTGALAVRWECALDDDARDVFSALVNHLNYLGRSESWVLGEVIGDDAALPEGFDAYPHVDGLQVERGWEQVSLLAPAGEDSYTEWRARCVAKALEAVAETDKRKAAKERAKVEEPYPADVLDCLQKDTAWWKRHRWSQPPGSRRVLYWRSTEALSVGPPSPASRVEPQTITAILLALTTSSGSRSALPSCNRTLPQAELLHRSLVAHVGRGDRVDCPELTGKDATGHPLRGHRHAHLLPLDLDGDGHLDHIVVHAPMGLGADAQKAVRSLKRTWTKGGVGDLQVAIAGQGDLRDLRRLPAPLDDGVAAVLGPAEGARIWRSSTPFVPPRYPKRHGSNTIQAQVLAELSSRGLPQAEVRVLPWTDATRGLRHVHRVRRHPAAAPPVDTGVALELVFAEPVQGPITLGYAAHFGLGLFVAVAQ